MTRLIGLDVGTSSTKAIEIDEHGTVLREVERAYDLSTPQPGWAEQDPSLWEDAAHDILAELDGAGADGLGLAGQMHGLVLLDEAGEVLRPAILWNDGRTQAQCDEIEDTIGFERLIQLTGNRALAGFTAPKLRWVAEHEPEILERVRTVLLPKDHVRLRLTGERAMDVSDASGTLWLDVAQRTWSEEVLKALEVDPAWLPPALESGAESGRAFDGRVPVAAGAGDQAAGALGVGVLDASGPASVVLGTSGVVFAARDSYAVEPQGRLHSFCHAAGGRWHVMGVMLSAAGSLGWLQRSFGGGASFSDLIEEAAAWDPGAEGLLFAPYLSGERTPWADPRARGAFTGLSIRHDRGALVRAVLEGVAFGLADGWKDMQELGGAPATARISGGGARSELWCKIVASVLGVPVERTAVEAGAAYGAALLGGVAAGVWSDEREAVEACVKVTGTVEPDPAWVERYAELHTTYQELYPALKPFRAAA